MFETLLYLRANLFVCRVLAAYFSKFLLSGPLITFLETGLFTVPSPMAQFHFHTSNISFCVGATPQQVKQCQSSSPVCLSWAQTNQTCLALSTCLSHATISVWNANPLLWKQASCRVHAFTAATHCYPFHLSPCSEFPTTSYLEHIPEAAPCLPFVHCPDLYHILVPLFTNFPSPSSVPPEMR